MNTNYAFSPHHCSEEQYVKILNDLSEYKKNDSEHGRLFIREVESKKCVLMTKSAPNFMMRLLEIFHIYKPQSEKIGPINQFVVSFFKENTDNFKKHQNETIKVLKTILPVLNDTTRSTLNDWVENLKTEEAAKKKNEIDEQIFAQSQPENPEISLDKDRTDPQSGKWRWVLSNTLMQKIIDSKEDEIIKIPCVLKDLQTKAEILFFKDDDHIKFWLSTETKDALPLPNLAYSFTLYNQGSGSKILENSPLKPGYFTKLKLGNVVKGGGYQLGSLPISEYKKLMSHGWTGGIGAELQFLSRR